MDPLAAGVTVGFPTGVNGEFTVGIGVGLGVGVTLALGIGVGLGVGVGLTVTCENCCPLTYIGVVKDAKMTSSKESVVACFKEIVAPPVQRQSVISKRT